MIKFNNDFNITKVNSYTSSVEPLFHAFNGKEPNGILYAESDLKLYNAILKALVKHRENIAGGCCNQYYKTSSNWQQQDGLFLCDMNRVYPIIYHRPENSFDGVLTGIEFSFFVSMTVYQDLSFHYYQDHNDPIHQLLNFLYFHAEKLMRHNRALINTKKLKRLVYGL